MTSTLSPIITTEPNGLRIAADTNPGIESVTVSIAVGIGSRYETEKNQGISHFLEHMAFKGTKKRSAKQIAEEVDLVGGSMNAYTSKEVTVYYIKVLKQDTPLAFDILSDILQNSVFEQEELEKERDVILQELANSVDTPDDIVFDYFFNIAYPNQPIGRAILGTQETIKSIDKSGLQEYISQKYNAGNIIISVSGNISNEEVLDLSRKYFNSLPPKKDISEDKAKYAGGSFRQNKEDLTQVQYLLGYQGYGVTSDERYTADIACNVLGGGMSSRLFQEIREKMGLVYTISAFHSSFSDAGIFGVYAGTSPEKLEVLDETVSKELKKVTQDVTKTELERTMNQYKASILMGLESSYARSRSVAKDLLQYGRFIGGDEILKRVSKITTDDVQNIMQEILRSPQTKVLYGKLDK